MKCIRNFGTASGVTVRRLHRGSYGTVPVTGEFVRGVDSVASSSFTLSDKTGFQKEKGLSAITPSPLERRETLMDSS
jgi:hypothetical protein